MPALPMGEMQVHIKWKTQRQKERLFEGICNLSVKTVLKAGYT